MPFLAVAAVGVGISAAGAAGAFSSKVDAQGPTLEELAAANSAKATYGLGKKIQKPLDTQARKDLQYLGSNQAMSRAGDMGVNQLWQQAGPQFGAGLNNAAKTSGGPGNGRWWDQVGRGTAGLDAGLNAAQLQGRLGGLNQYMARTGQFMGRRSQDLREGLDMMTTGGALAQQNKQNRIMAQTQNNIAANQAAGQIGGSLMSVGMMGMGGGGGMSGSAEGVGNVFGDMYNGITNTHYGA